MSKNTKSIGELSEGMILGRILQLGYSLSIPFGNNQRYDMIIDDGSKLYKVQCKTGRYINGCVSFSAASKNGFTNVRRTYENDVDIFLIYCPQLDTFYKVPVGKATKNEMRLRVDPVKAKAPTSKINWAKDFIF